MSSAGLSGLSAAMRTRASRLFGLTVAIAVIAGAGCGGGGASGSEDPTSDSTPAPSGEIANVEWAVEGEPATLDPIYSYNLYDNKIVSNLCEPLVRLEPDLTYSNWLAEDVERTSPTTWVYTIRKGVKFWDGSLLTAEDVAYSLNRNLDPDLGSYFVDNFARVKSIKTTGPMEVTVALNKPDAIWNQTISLGGADIVNKSYAQDAGTKFGTPDGGLMCTGPFELDSFRRGDSVQMSRFADYWNQDAAALSERFTFNFISDPSAQAQALLANEIQGMYLQDPSGIPRLQSADGDLYFGKGFLMQYLIPSLKTGPLQDPKIRQALSLAIDRDAIANTVFEGAAQPLRTQVGEAQFPPEEEAGAVYQEAWDAAGEPTADVEAASKLVEQAGSPSEPIVITHVAGGAQQQLAEAIQDAGRRIGLNVELNGLSENAFYGIAYDPKAIADSGTDAMSIGFDVSVLDPFQLYQVFIPSVRSVYNYPKYSNPKVTSLLEQAYGEYDPVARAKLVTQAEEIVGKDLPFIPIVSLDTVLYMGPDITGAPVSPSHWWSPWANMVGAR